MGVETGDNVVECSGFSGSGCGSERIKKLAAGSKILKYGHLMNDFLVTGLGLVGLSANTLTR